MVEKKEETYDKSSKGCCGLLRASLDDAVRNSKAIDDLGRVLGLDGLLCADGHEIRRLGVVDWVHVVFLFHPSVDGRFLCLVVSETLLEWPWYVRTYWE